MIYIKTALPMVEKDEQAYTLQLTEPMSRTFFPKTLLRLASSES